MNSLTPNATHIDQPSFYLVGGAVRDRLLGLPITDRDWVVVGATPEYMTQQGFKPVGNDFPVFLHPKTGEEYALARTERKTSQGHQGFTFYCTADVTLEADLQRRDITINAMAEDKQGHIIDPMGGKADLDDRWLRHVSPAFSEDPLRVLRVARFLARFDALGFRIAPETLNLMRSITSSGELATLTPERVWQETHSALSYHSPSIYFQTLLEIGALHVLCPRLAEHLSPSTNSTSNISSTSIETDTDEYNRNELQQYPLIALKNAAAAHASTLVRFASLVHGLCEHAPLQKSLKPLQIPRHFLAFTQTCHHIYCTSQSLSTPSKTRDAHLLLSLFDQCDAWRRPERFTEALRALPFLLFDSPKTLITHFQTQFAVGMQAALSVSAKTVLEKFPSEATAPKGKALGEAIQHHRLQAITAALSVV